MDGHKMILVEGIPTVFRHISLLDIWQALFLDVFFGRIYQIMSFGGKEKLILVGEILSFRIICSSFLENLLELFLALSYFRNVQKKAYIWKTMIS